ncbi:peptidase [Streptomyces sp. NPDC050145]|uniref:peptidase n=1 Tax=Streptomyces sp. NPDC050145 TaxID=3365602 RepID=UPI0037AF7D46
MKLRRALVTAAATAALAPIALLSAPAAFADDPAPVTTAGATDTQPTETPDPAPSTDAPGTGESDGSADAEQPPAGGTEDGSGSEAGTEDGSGAEAGTGEEAGTEPGTEPGAEDGTKTETPGTETPTTTSPSPSETTDPLESCDDVADEDDKGTVAELRGLPSKIVAGSGWHDFTYRVANASDRDFDKVYASLYVFAVADDAEGSDATKYLTVQWRGADGWHDAAIGDETMLPFQHSGPLAPGEHADFALRIQVDAKAPAGFGAGVSLGMSVDSDGLCSFNDGENSLYEFEILAAGTKPGEVPPAKGKPGKPVKPRPSNTPAPQASSTPLGGSLAETGSSSMLPTVGMIGGIAVVAGAGVVYSVRRRKVGAEG